MNGEIEAAWAIIRRESRVEPGWHMRRLDIGSSCETFAGVRQPESSPGVILEVAVDDVPNGLSLPQSRGFTVEPSLVGRGSGRARFALILADRAYESVFSVLCEDAMRAAAEEAKPQAAVRAWVNRLYVWQEFMARYGAHGLSERAATGLFGELVVMRDFLIPSAGSLATVEGWCGPLGEPNDFAFSSGFLEVKTTTLQAPDVIGISDLDQLDDNRGRILLGHVMLRRSAKGESLRELVSSVRARISCDAAEALHRFEQLLVSAGYLDIHSEFYGESYEFKSLTIFKVEGDFPRLRSSDLRGGIRSLSYTIEVGACLPYVIERRSVDDLFQVP